LAAAFSRHRLRRSHPHRLFLAVIAALLT
jgi:hypothetical protein